MATADFVGSVTAYQKGSEETFDYECDACKLDNTIREAKFYCPPCADYLCTDCETHHKKVKATRFHEIVCVDDMVKEHSERKTAIPVVKIACPCGQGKEINYYCCEHDDCFCLLCKTVRHRNCNTLSISEACDGSSVVKDFSTLAEKTRVLTDQAKELQHEYQKCMTTLEDIDKNCKEEIKKFRSKLNLFLGEIERSSLDDLKRIVEIQSRHLEENATAVDSTFQLLQKHEKDIKDVSKAPDKSQVFIANSKLRKSLRDCETVLEDVKSKMDVPSISFERDKTLDNLQNMINILGKIKIAHKKGTSVSTPVLVDASCVHHTTADIQAVSSKKDKSITGIEFVNDNMVLIADHGSGKLALLDASLKIKEVIDCDGPPYDLASCNDSEVVATLPYQQTLLYVQINPKLKIIEKKGLHNRCWGLAHAKQTLYVACNFSGERPEILELDESRQVKRIISCKQIDKNLSYVFNIAVNQEGARLYISDYWSHKVICATTGGELMFSYSDSNLKYPRGILLDGDNNALVCCESSNNIHVIKSDGTKHKSLLTSKDGIQTPFAINYRVNDGMLAVGCWHSSSLLVFFLRA